MGLKKHRGKEVRCSVKEYIVYTMFDFSGTFKLTLVFTEDYPNKAPTVRFESKMFHPNSALS